MIADQKRLSSLINLYLLSVIKLPPVLTFYPLHYRYSLPLLFFAQDIEEQKTRLVQEEVSKARKEWSEQQSCSNQTDVDDQIAAARQEWIKEHNDELEKRLSNAIEEVRRIWDEEQKLKTKEVRNLPLLTF